MINKITVVAQTPRVKIGVEEGRVAKGREGRVAKGRVAGAENRVAGMECPCAVVPFTSKLKDLHSSRIIGLSSGFGCCVGW